MGLLACIAAFFICYSTARESLGKGILAVLTVGYGYGIFRAHFLDSFGYFLFDSAVLGVYAGSLRCFTTPPRTPGERTLTHWVHLLIFIPVIMALLPFQDYWVQLVGLRGNIFFLPFLLLGARLDANDRCHLGLGLSVLNLLALSVAVAELLWGVDHFFPQNSVTDLVYMSHDVGSMNAYRIPATFANAHSYGGQMVMSLPFIIGAWSQPVRKAWYGPILTGGVLAAAIGVFLSAARVHFIALTVLVLISTFSLKLRTTQRLAWIAMVGFMFYLVMSHERMQRFKTLEDQGVVTSRIEGSINASLMDALIQYPMGNGIGGGGTSLPYFLADRVQRPMAIESEYGRIQLELGVFGLGAWVAFLFWFFTRPKPRSNDPWFVGKRLAWAVCSTNCVLAAIGTGLLTAIPISALMMLAFGWLVTDSAPVWQGLSNEGRLAYFRRDRDRLLPAVPHPTQTHSIS